MSSVQSTPDKQQTHRGRAIWLGIGAGTLAGLLLFLLNQSLDHSGFYLASDFTLVPLAMGIVGQFYWRVLTPRVGRRFGLASMTAALACGLAAVFLGEGAICLLMAVPLLVPLTWLGAEIGVWLFGRADSRLRATVLPLLLALMVCDALTPHGYENAVTDTVMIHAPPARVWRYVAGYPRITTPPDYWLWRIGLPCPVQSTADGAFVGATRRCIFTRNAVFQERITVCRPARELTFAITAQPHDPEIVGHLALERGQFMLRDNRDGTTTLIGTSWYRLNVYPVSYFDLWTRNIIRHVHRRVMAQIQSLAQSPEKTAPDIGGQGAKDFYATAHRH